jgi:hypothetical protein
MHNRAGDRHRCHPYPKGIKIPKAALKGLNIKYDDFHGDWNYTISPITNQETGKSPSK